MKGAVQHLFEVQIVLSEAEARWLKDLVQNYLGEGIESSKDATHRKTLFSILNESLK